MTCEVSFSVFTKPWPDVPLPELGAFVRGLGFDGIELPVRPGFQVEPQRVENDLPRAVAELAREGVKVLSIAGPADERTITACAVAGVSVIRVMARIADGERYTEAEARLRREYAALQPVLEQRGVTLGVQNHCDSFVPNALGLRALLKDFDADQIAAVWDAAHEALVGTSAPYALDVVWDHLCMVNLKNGFWRRLTGPEGEQARWEHYWTDAHRGLADWPCVVAELQRRAYRGVVCLTAEYSDRESVDRLIAEDLRYAKELFAETGPEEAADD